MISPGAKVISGSVVNLPTGLNFPDFLNWNLKSLFASLGFKVFPCLNFLTTPLRDLGNFCILTSSKTIAWGLIFLRVISPAKISKREASF